MLTIGRRRMADHDVDLFVIGAGSGGVRAARIASSYGAVYGMLRCGVPAANFRIRPRVRDGREPFRLIRTVVRVLALQQAP